MTEAAAAEQHRPAQHSAGTADSDTAAADIPAAVSAVPDTAADFAAAVSTDSAPAALSASVKQA